MIKEELLQKEIDRILQEHPEDPVEALRQKRRRAIIVLQTKTIAQKPGLHPPGIIEKKPPTNRQWLGSRVVASQ
jgi:hypothetical protein